MVRKSNKEYLALPVAAHLARTRLVPDPTKVYDPEHLNEMLNIAAQALMRATRLYFVDPDTGEMHELGALELDGAVAKRGATRLTLRSGRSIAGVTVLRNELLDAIALLKKTGVPGLTSPLAEPPARPPEAPADPLALLRDMEALIHPPVLGSELQRATKLAVALARGAQRGEIANLAMRLVSELHESRGKAAMGEGVRLAFERLRAALEEQKKPA